MVDPNMKPLFKYTAVAATIVGLVGSGMAAGNALARPSFTFAPSPEGRAGAPIEASGAELNEELLQRARQRDRTGDAPSTLTGVEQQTVSIFKTAAPSVVFITRLRKSKLSLDATEVKSGSGSGIIWDTQGHIVTNHHVIDGASGARVTLADRSTYDAVLVGSSPDKDIAVLKIDAPPQKLRALAVGASQPLLVGQHVFAIGNPFGLDHTLSTGVISGLGREIKSRGGHPITGVVQTDAAINPGNSGGPLLDSAGRLIGINTAIYSPTGASAGIGFAVPVDTVKRIVPQLIEHGKVVKPRLGISIGDRVRGVSGVVVMGVQDGSGADKAGLRATSRDRRGRIVLGDVIIAVDAKKIRNNTDLFRALDGKKPGDSVELTIRRGDKRRKLKVRLSLLDK